jgi:hypothetical protein
MLNALEMAVPQVLEKNRHLGQYTVVWRDGGLVKISEDAQKNPEKQVCKRIRLGKSASNCNSIPQNKALII